MATYPNVNAANQYARDIVGGKILACQLTVLACQRHLDDLERAKDPHWPYRFDKNKAERFLRFAQKMPHIRTPRCCSFSSIQRFLMAGHRP